MQKIACVSALALSALAGPAFAADLPSFKAPVLVPVAPPPALWTGFYAGVNAGGTFANSTSLSSGAASLFNDAAPAAAGTAGALSATGVVNSDHSGFIGGGQIGYNYQFYNSLVLGLEADIQGVAGSGGGSGFVGAAADPLGSPATMVTAAQFQRSADYLGTVRGRLGFLVTPTLLAYGTGGLAYGGVNLNSAYFTADLSGLYGPGFGGASYSDTRVGWTAGGGLEWLFAPNWSAKVEYLYYDLGSVTTSSVVAGSNALGGLGWAHVASTSARFDGHVVRLGLNYHFNWAAPASVVAKY